LLNATEQFLRGFRTLYGSKYAIQKVKINGKALEDSIQMDWTLEVTGGFKGQNIAYSSKRRLIRMSASGKRGMHFEPWTF